MRNDIESEGMCQYVVSSRRIKNTIPDTLKYCAASIELSPHFDLSVFYGDAWRRYGSCGLPSSWWSHICLLPQNSAPITRISANMC